MTAEARIESLADAVPNLAGKLTALADKIEDLLPVVRDHVYHPDFGGSFSIKKVLPALVPNLGYDDLEIGDGGTAATALETLLLDAESLTEALRKELRRNLLAYCERDTLAMVRLSPDARMRGSAIGATSTASISKTGSPLSKN